MTSRSIPRLLRSSTPVLPRRRVPSTLRTPIPALIPSLRPQSRVPTTPAPVPFPSRTPVPAAVQTRTYTNGGTSGKSEPDVLVDELQELYEIATDEFEIATDSTDSATIYAASDRESARDALDQLLVVYTLYTTDVSSTEFQNTQREQEARRLHEEKEGQSGEGEEEGGDEGSKVVTTNVNPEAVSAAAREEVRKRVGQRVRELRNALENLEERAKIE